MNLNRGYYLLLIFAGIASLWTAHSLAMWFLLTNLLTLIIYGVDKMAARKNGRRVPEFTLLAFGFLGGWCGAYVGQQLFRHKTRKQPFKTYFVVSSLASVLLMAAIYFLRTFISY